MPNKNTDTPVTMEIINSEQFKRANIRFNGKPSDEIREELKKEGWFYSRNHNVWYPKNDAAENSQTFANHIKETYFPEDKNAVQLITEASEKDELLAMVKEGSSLKEILSKLSDMYGEDAVHEALENAKEGIEDKTTPSLVKKDIPDILSVKPDNNETLALCNSQTGEFVLIRSSDEYVWDYTIFNKDYIEIDGGVAGDIASVQELIIDAARTILEDTYPETPLGVWEKSDYEAVMAKAEKIEELRLMNNKSEVDLTSEEQEIRNAQGKFGDVVREVFLNLSDEEKEAGTTAETKHSRYQKWFAPMVDEIMAEIGNSNKEIIEKIMNFELDHEKHLDGNKWYTADEAFLRDVQYKLLPDLYEKVQDKIKKEYEEKKIPYVIMYSSESPVFPSENKVYTVKEFNELILQADKEFHNRREYAEKKYGSADNYWNLENEDKLPEEDKGIQFGYDKTNFKLFNIPNPANPEDTFSYEPSRYDIGDGNGSVFDYVRATCSHDEFIEAMNKLEIQLYYPNVSESQIEFVQNTVKEVSVQLKEKLKSNMEDLDKAQNDYKELHKKWLIEATEADKVDEELETAVDAIKNSYESSINTVYEKVLAEYPFASGIVNDSEFLQFIANETKKMAISELYLPSREAQKAMNAEDYKTYNSFDWAKQRRIWEVFPANVNMSAYTEDLLQKACNEYGMNVSETSKAVVPPVHSVEQPSLFDSVELTEEDLEICKKVIPPNQYAFTLELSRGEEGDFYRNKLKDIADTYRRINVDHELVNKDGTHQLGFRYFLGDTEIFFSEIDSEGIGFGYNILNGDLQMSEWGSTSLSEILSIPYMEMDYHTPDNTTIEAMLYKEHPDYFTEYAPKSSEQEKVSPSTEISWDKIYDFFEDHIKDSSPSINETRLEVGNEHYETELQKKEEVIARLLENNVDWSLFKNEGRDTDDDELPGKILEEKWAFIEDIAAKIADGTITSFEVAQVNLNDDMLKSELYKEVQANRSSNTSENPSKKITCDFFVANNIEFEDELYSGLTLEEAIEKYAEVNKDWGGELSGFIPCIGIDTHDGSMYDSGPDGHGQIIFDGRHINTGVLDDIPHFADMVEYRSAIFDLYNALSDAGYEFDEYEQNKIDQMWKKYNSAEKDIENTDNGYKPIDVYTFSPFGYEGSLVLVETDLRRGIPAVDIVGLADSAVKETRERIRAAFKNSELQFPTERVLISLSPADIRKEAPMDVAIALGILAKQNEYKADGPVLALGELELNGNIRPVRGAVASVNTAKEAGITNIVCDPNTAKLLKDIDGINILAAENLKDAHDKLLQEESFKKTKPKLYEAETVQFNDELMSDWEESIKDLPIEGHYDTVRAMEIAVAGKHNILTTGAPGCGKTLLTQTLIPVLTPKMTQEEASSQTRIKSLAGLDSPRDDKLVPAFRMPHQTATIEGMCGGGVNCRPGEISLAHNGILFLDEAAEFRSSVLQMLRVPLESRHITLSRAGRSTTYPADFQLVMAMNPCPCGNYGSHDKICLDSARSIEQYWKKISDPLMDRIEIKNFCEKDEHDSRTTSIEEMKSRIAKAYEIQRKRGVYNSHLTPDQILQYCKLDKECQEYVNAEEGNLNPREKANLLKLSLTIANMDGREEIRLNDLKEARELSAPVFEKPKKFVYQPAASVEEENGKDLSPKLLMDDTNISVSQINEADKERKRITEPVLNGERTGMYKAFKDFEDKGVFDIQGSTVRLSKNGGLTTIGWKQLQAAMEIYRSKKFETFRYILIDRKTGEITDQLAITSHMPNFCNVTKPHDETLKQVITRAEEKDCLIAVCHNHPSGNTTESSFDRELTDSLNRSLCRSDGNNLFAGHIILDHDTFNLGYPGKSNSCKWKKLEPLKSTEIDRFNAEPQPEWAGKYVGSTSALKEVAIAINDTDNWNDDFIPVVFTNSDRNITGVQYYSRKFFENESDKVRNEFQFAAMEAGAIGAFPVITDSFWAKLGKDSPDFEEIMKSHVMNDAVTDVAFNHTTITEKHDIRPGRNFYNYYHDQAERKVDVVSTWEPTINASLFPPDVVGQIDEYETTKSIFPRLHHSEEAKIPIEEKHNRQNHDIER